MKLLIIIALLFVISSCELPIAETCITNEQCGTKDNTTICIISDNETINEQIKLIFNSGGQNGMVQ